MCHALLIARLPPSVSKLSFSGDPQLVLAADSWITGHLKVGHLWSGTKDPEGLLEMHASQ